MYVSLLYIRHSILGYIFLSKKLMYSPMNIQYHKRQQKAKLGSENGPHITILLYIVHK